MEQLILDLTLMPRPVFDNFVVTYNNQEVVAALTQPMEERFIYLWGAAGSGKTHLLQAWRAQAAISGRSAIYLDSRRGLLTDSAREADNIAIDHIDDLAAGDQLQLFSLYNSLKESGKARLLMAGRQPPMRLVIRDDLRTRVAWGLVFEVNALSDDDKLAILSAHAVQRQLVISDDVFCYLLTHWRRDLASLMAMLDLLDRYSLSQQRSITIPLLKSLLQMGTSKNPDFTVR